MAACSSGRAGTGGAAGSGGDGGAGNHDSGVFDAFTDPVSDAMAGTEDPQSGTRLKGKFTKGADGSKEYQLTMTPGGSTVHQVWFDSMLHADCSFVTAADGQLHCLPGEPESTSNGVEVAFSDAQCTQPMVFLYNPGITGCTPPASPPAYVQMITPSTCAATMTHVYQPGSATTAPAHAYAPNTSSGTCDPIDPAAGLTVIQWYTATETAPSTFVQGMTGVDP